MKYLLLLLTFFFTTIFYCQTLTLNGVNKYTKDNEIIIAASPLNNFRGVDAINESENEYFYFSVKKNINHKTQETGYFVQLNVNRNIKGSITCFTPDSELILHLSNDEEITLKSINRTICGSNILVVFKSSLDTIKKLSEIDLDSFTTYTDGYDNMKVWKHKRKIIKETCKMFLEEIEK